MRLRLVHQISLLLLGTAALAVLAMGGLTAWTLKSGFSEYLRGQDAQLLDRLMLVAEADLQRLGGLPEGDLKPKLREWLDGAAPRPRRERGGDRLDRPDRPDRPGPDERGNPPHRPPPPPHQARGDDFPPPPRPPRDPDNLGPRLMLFTPDGQQLLAGRPEMLGRKTQERMLKLHGQDLALLRLAERSGPAAGLDASFLRRQYLDIAGVGVVLLLLALFAAGRLARRWVRPLQQAQVAARRMAHGEFQVRIPEGTGEDELDELTRDLNAMAASLETMEGSRKRWIAELSHELRTPLAVLRGELEAMADGVRPTNAQALSSLQEEVRRLSRLTDDFHTLACSDLRALPCQFAPLQPGPLFAAALARLQERARGQGLTLESDWPADLPTVSWDAQRITQLLGNLLENSLRYTDAPGRIRLSARLQAGQLQVRVEDSPPGVPAAALEQLFDPLYRVEGSRNRGTGGSGLGLAIARALALSHQGRLQAEASALGGLCMVLWMPLHPQSPMPADPASTRKA